MHRAVTRATVGAFEGFQRALDVGVAAVFALEGGEEVFDPGGIQQGVAHDVETADVDQGGVAVILRLLNRYGRFGRRHITLPPRYVTCKKRPCSSQ